MLTHKSNTAAFGGLMILLLLLHFFLYQLPFVVFIVPAFIYFVLLAWGSAQINSNYHLPVICLAYNHPAKEIAFTFDDGPDANITPKVLELLRRHQITSIFFCIGNKIKDNENLLKQIADEGHLIGNHSFSHATLLDFFGTSAIKEELEKTNDLVNKSIGQKPQFFRPPYGVTTPNIAAAVAQLNMHTIGWSIRSLDTLNQSPEKIAARVNSQIKPGSILLFHDTNERVLPVLEQTIDFCKKNGYKIVRPDQLLNLPAYE